MVHSIAHEFKRESETPDLPRKPEAKGTAKVTTVQGEGESELIRDLKGVIHRLSNQVEALQQQQQQQQWQRLPPPQQFPRRQEVEKRAKSPTRAEALMATGKEGREKGRTLAKEPNACWHCGNHGHMKSECPELPEYFRCHRRGHVQKYCRLNWQ